MEYLTHSSFLIHILLSDNRNTKIYIKYDYKKRSKKLIKKHTDLALSKL